MAKDKRKKKEKKAGKAGGVAGKTSKTLRAVAGNPLVADVVAAALVATASALKDSNKARRMAANVSDELESLAKDQAKRGNAMWKLALDIGRQALDEITGTAKGTKRSAASPKAKPARKSTTAPAKKAKRSTAAKKPRRRAV